jgi:hypothetical protein
MRSPPSARVRAFLSGACLGALLHACTGGLSEPNKPAGSAPGASRGGPDEGSGPGANPARPGASNPGSVIGMSSAALGCDERPIDPGPAPLRLLSRDP